MNELTVDYDPDIDSEGSYTGANLKLEKHDGTVNYGSVYIAPGAERVAYTDYADHHYDSNGTTDTHGGNLRVWTESGAQPLQLGTYGPIYFRRPEVPPVVVTFRPQFYRRVLG
jgi:hypothetical protein